MRRLLILLTVLALAIGAVACGDDDDETTVTETASTQTDTATEEATATVAGEPVDCGLPPPEGGGFFDLFATDVDCGTAENVRQAWSTQCAGSDTGAENCLVTDGFSCSYESTGYESTAITCERADDGAVVTFKTGS